MKRHLNLGLSGFAFVLFMVVFVLPFIFILLTAAKTPQESAMLDFSWPTEWQFVQNLRDVIQARDYIVITAFVNSTIITVFSVTGHRDPRRDDGVRPAATARTSGRP